MDVGISRTPETGRQDIKSTCAPLWEQVGDAKPSQMALGTYIQATEHAQSSHESLAFSS